MANHGPRPRATRRTGAAWIKPTASVDWPYWSAQFQFSFVDHPELVNSINVIVRGYYANAAFARGEKQYDLAKEMQKILANVEAREEIDTSSYQIVSEIMWRTQELGFIWPNRVGVYEELSASRVKIAIKVLRDEETEWRLRKYKVVENVTNAVRETDAFRSAVRDIYAVLTGAGMMTDLTRANDKFHRFAIKLLYDWDECDETTQKLIIRSFKTEI